MAFQSGSLDEALSASKSHGWATALLLGACAWWCSALTRLLVFTAARSLLQLATELAAHASSHPLELGLVLALLASAVTYCTDRHQRAVQALATLHPKLWGLLFVQQVKRCDNKCKSGVAAAGAEQQQQEEQKRGSPTGSPSASQASSPGPLASPGVGEGPFSHRLEQLGRRRSDARRRRAASASPTAAGKGAAARWSLDAAPPLAHEAARRRQGTTRLEFQLKPRTSVDFDVAAAATPRSSPERDAASGPVADARRQRRRPAMQRIASGEQLRELGCGGDGGSAAPASPPALPSSWLPSGLTSWASLSLSTDRLPTPESLVASISAASSAWVGRFVPSALERSASAPVEGADAAATAAAAHLTPAQRRDSIEHARRCSLEGASARHYCFGAIAAHPSRTAALAACAVAARGGGSPGSAASALASLGLDGDCPQAIREHVTDEHLLQFGSLIGDAPAAEAGARLGMPGAWAAADALLGLPDTPRCHAGGWERCASGAHEGLTYEAERLPLRGGLYIYRSRAVVAGVEPRDVRPFQLDDAARPLWDENAVEIERLVPPGVARAPQQSEWCLHRYRSRFPRPMAAREYTYARRVWHRPSDGGCYAICRSLGPGAAALAAAVAAAEAGGARRGGARPSRSVAVQDYVSAVVLRAVPGGTEIVQVYYEDSGVRPGLAKMAVPKGLWPYICKFEDSLRVFAAARRASSAANGSGDGAGRQGLAAAAARGAELASEFFGGGGGGTMDDAPASMDGVYAALRSRRASSAASSAGSVRRRAALRTYGRHLALVAGIKLLAVLAGRGRGPGGPLPFAAG